MANSTATPTVNNYPFGVDAEMQAIDLFGTIAIAAGSYPANGIPINFSGIKAGANGAPKGPARIESASSGFIYRHDIAHGTVRIFVTGTAANDPLNEVATTTPAAVVSDTITFQVTLNKVGGTEG